MAPAICLVCESSATIFQLVLRSETDALGIYRFLAKRERYRVEIIGV